MNIDEPTEAISKSRNQITARRINILLALIIVGVMTFYWGRLIRRAEFLRTGAVTIDGHALHLDKNDVYMTGVVLTTGEWEPAQTVLTRRLLKPGDTFVDVGANVGWYTVVASDAVGPAGRVYAFEPDPTSGSLLRRNVARNRCRNAVIENKALSNRRGTLTLHLNSENLGNHSIIKSNLQDSEHGAIEVEAVSLDEYLADRPGEIALVKIDTEGAEGIILEGMRETMLRHPRMAIILEFNPLFIRQAGFDPEVMLRRFHDAGYTIENINEAAGRLEPVSGVRITDFVRSGFYYTNILIHRPGARLNGGPEQR